MSKTDDRDTTAEAGTTDIPPAIAAAWGVRERPGKGPKPGLSVGRIVQAATQAALQDGLAAVSMNRVAAEVGTAAMSLYRYVSGKDELLMLMVDAAFGPPPEIPAPDEDWRAGLNRWARSSLDIMRKNPWAVRVPVSGPPIAPNQVAWLERGLRCLTDTTLTEAEKISVILLISGVVRNEATLNAQIGAWLEQGGSTPDDAMQAYSRLLSTLVDHDRDRFPALTKLLDEGVMEVADPEGTDFEFAMERVLDGVEVLIERRSGE